jgi:hypothetical protein
MKATPRTYWFALLRYNGGRSAKLRRHCLDGFEGIALTFGTEGWGFESLRVHFGG